MKKAAAFLLPTVLLGVTYASAQQVPASVPHPVPQFREDALDPSPVDPAVDPNVDMFINDWRNSKARFMYGKLEFRDILTRLDTADKVHPIHKGAVLSDIDAVSHAELAPNASVSGREQAGKRQVFYTKDGTGQISVNGKSYPVREGTGFVLTPDFDFKLTNSGKAPLVFYVRSEPIPPNTPPSPDITVTNRFDSDRRVGNHWVHTCNGGPRGMLLCTIQPHTIPQPHSHSIEEIWILVKGESVLSLGKNLLNMHPGQAYRIPPTGMAAHSNLNLTEEPIEMIYMGPAVASPSAGRDFARINDNWIDQAADQDVDMYLGNWHDAYPRMMHGNLIMRDMLTALRGPDPLHPTRKGAVLVNAQAVSYGMLEPGSTAHKIEGELKGLQESFVVNSGTGFIAVGDKKIALSKGIAFLITPGLDFKLTASGEKYMTFYVVTEKLPAGYTPKDTLEVTDNRSKPQTINNWYDKERPLFTKADGLSQYSAMTEVELKPMAMSRPYSAAPGTEEIWIATDGDVEMLFGKILRKIPAGTAYSIPPTGFTAHANINVSGKPASFLYVVK